MRNGFLEGQIDGFYGPSTQEAVARFQERHGLTADGIAGPRTLDALAKYGWEPGMGEADSESMSTAATSPGDNKFARFSDAKSEQGKAAQARVAKTVTATSASADELSRQAASAPPSARQSDLATPEEAQPSGTGPRKRAAKKAPTKKAAPRKAAPAPAAEAEAEPTTVAEPTPAPEPAPAAEPQPAAASTVPATAPTPKIVSDIWIADDNLGYLAYARALAALITHEETRPPLTIGIKAPWGAGKTSLMHMVQHQLDGTPEKTAMTGEASDAPDAGSMAVDGAWEASATYGTVLRTLESPRKPRFSVRLGNNPGARLGIPARATVWFNAWKYQNSEQIWAGLAHCIISQVTARLPALERERFWLELHARRVDVNQVRRQVYRVVLEEFLPHGLFWAGIAAAAGIVALAAPGAWTLLPLGGAAASVWQAVREWQGKLSGKLAEPVQGMLRDFLRAPSYEGKLGFLHLVESDVREVMDLVASAEEPLVIFIDDLDRCAPRRVAEVVEAINLFLAGDYPNCVFVIGMEPEMVAAALEAANKDMKAGVSGVSLAEDRAPLGWRFMEKIIQLPLTLPPPGRVGLARYLDSLLGEGPAAPAEPAEQDVARAAEALRQAGDIAEVVRLTEEMRQAGGAAAEAVAEASKRVYTEKFRSRDPLIRGFLERAVTLFQANPRQLKRYLNLFRFNATLRHAFQVDGLYGPGGAPFPGDEALAKFVALAVNWPQAMATLRARAEDEGAAGSLLCLLERRALALADGDPAQAQGQWEDFVKARGLDADWARERDFRDFLATGPALWACEGCGLW